MIEILDPGPRIDETHIGLLERTHGIKLPPAYREFLLQHDGGCPSPDTIDIPGLPDSPTDIHIFFGINRSIESSELSWNFSLVENYQSTLLLVPIACDSGGNLFCLQASGSGDSVVLYLDRSCPGRQIL